jgi:hypothetical protein
MSETNELTNLQNLSASTKAQLKTVAGVLESFLNDHTLTGIVEQQPEVDATEATQYYRGILADLRYLNVFAEEYYERLGNLLRRPNLDEKRCEWVLYEVYHRVVSAFFYPKNEGYSEDGRYAYTGKDAIRFQMRPVRSVRDTVLSLSHIFETLRDDLAHYESDYKLHLQTSGGKPNC